MPDIWGIAAIFAKLTLYFGVVGSTGLVIILAAFPNLVLPLCLIAGMFIPRFGTWVSLAGGTIALWSFAKIGHVPDLQQTGEHLDDAALLGHRFGQAAAVIVPVLILAGLLMAWLLLGDLRALLSTGYGQTLLIKLVLVGAILILAAANN